MNIRALTTKDAKLYWQLRLKTLRQNPHAFLVTIEEEENKSQPIKKVIMQLKDPSRITLGAFHRNQLIGAITLQREVYIKIKHKGSVLSFFVESDYRGRGIGRVLLENLISIAKMYDIEQLLLAVVSTNEKAIQLYESIGFTTIGMEKRALKVNCQYFDELHMVLFLNHYEGKG
ncbi:GNAT family N-acetyltransferase [Niallia sp. 03133]|uniref:GNAT family N-acetyltransferase n=1 Tax=Niallia sp. 03133 TaxID=3458060 RepID=UPI004044ED02